MKLIASIALAIILLAPVSAQAGGRYHHRHGGHSDGELAAGIIGGILGGIILDRIIIESQRPRVYRSYDPYDAGYTEGYERGYQRGQNQRYRDGAYRGYDEGYQAGRAGF